MSTTPRLPELKPCPFCGVELIANNNPADLYVQRYGTHYQHPVNNCYLSDDEVSPSNVAEWNRRLPLPEQGSPQ